MGSMFGKRYQEREAARWARDAEANREQKKANEERAGREAKRLRAQVRSDIEAAAENRAREAAEVATMSPAQLAARERRLQTEIHTPGPGKPTGYFLALEAIKREDRAREIEQRESEQNLPERQDKYDAVVQKIDAALEDALGEARRVCAESEQGARDRAETDRAELGERPQLQAEAVAVA